MAIKGGQILHVGNGVSVIDRIQTGGPGQLNIPTEKIYELGNYKSVATIRDTPDLTFSLESFDVSPEVEALVAGAYAGREVADGVTLTADATVTSATAAFTSADVGRQVTVVGQGTGGTDFVSTIASVTNGTTVELADPVPVAGTGVTLLLYPDGIDLATAVPVDFASQFKAGLTAPDPFLVTSSVALPFLYLEQMSYRFGLRDNATQSATLRGDTIFYNPGACYVEEVDASGSAGQVIVTDHPAYQVDGSNDRRVLAVTVGTQRLTFGADYTESYGAITAGAATTTVTITDAHDATDTVRIIYSSPDDLTYPQNVHPDTSVKPAAVKGRDIEVYVGGYDPNDVAGSQGNKLTSVQAATVDWRVTIEKDEEFGNYYAVGQDFDVPQVNGSIDIKPRDDDDFRTLLRKVTGVTDPLKVIGPDTAVPLELDIVIHNPETSEVIKRLHIPDARFSAPGYSGRVQQKLTVTLPFESDEGDLLVYRR